MMKTLLPAEEVTLSSTYHGARMNQKALDFHTHLHEWNEAQNLLSKHTQILTASRQHDLYLPVKKFAHIEYWAKQVNKYYMPIKTGRPKSSSFMKIDVSKYKMKVDRDSEIKRSKSAFYPKREPLPSSPCRPTTSHRQKLMATDLNTVKNNIVESQLHYSAQRNELYVPSVQKSKKLAEDGNAFQVKAVSEYSDIDDPDDYSETVTIIDLVDGGNVNEMETQSHHEADVMQPKIVARSCSNRMLNVISIDDCKLSCRYRPQIIKENRQIPNDDTEKHKQNRETASKKTKTKNTPQDCLANGNEADDEAEVSTDTINEVHQAMERLNVDDTQADQNNNTHACQEEPTVMTGGQGQWSDMEMEGSQHTGQSGMSSDPSSIGNQSKSFESHVHTENQVTPVRAQDHQVNFSSRGTNMTSYGRLTNLNYKSESSRPGGRSKKKPSRASRINQAINGVVQGRKVMNSLERDFDTRTAQFGRTTVATSDGSETFKKIHANLRKKIDKYMDTYSAIKAKDYLDKVRRNSISGVNQQHDQVFIL